jgi:tRNA(adenine34) deaminase
MTGDGSNAYERDMRRCIDLARRALATGDTPVGAVVVLNGRVIGEGIEGVKARRDVTGHAEIEALRAACRHLGKVDLTGCQLLTTVAPCVMCAYAIRLARVSVVVTGAESSDVARPLNGRIVLTNPGILPERPVPALISGVLESECQALLALRDG